ncbi:hypothetical protein [Thauera sp.]|uniref:hypothetical protein n=1 Tax=Thauera sp. TaxID=1905334 RepID=UPI002D1FACB4|nr:hypothetical protein [Thauera sp.]
MRQFPDAAGRIGVEDVRVDGEEAVAQLDAYAGALGRPAFDVLGCALVPDPIEAAPAAVPLNARSLPSGVFAARSALRHA